MSDFWKAAEAGAGKPLTLEDLQRTFEGLKNRPPHPCSLGQHIVNPKALYKPGWYVCGNCAMPVEVKVPLSEL